MPRTLIDEAFTLPANLDRQLRNARMSLQTFVDTARAEFTARPERWRYGRKGEDADAWLENLERLLDELDMYEVSP